MRSVKLPLLAAALALVAATAARAEVKVNPLFSDGMVLQQGGNAPLWGTADPGEQVSVSFGTDAQGVAAPVLTADKEGKWRVNLPMAGFKAGTGYTLTIKGKNTITIKDVAVGEVWFCSGQSNMEMSVNSSAGAAEAKAKARNPNVRLFTVRKTTADQPQSTVPVGGEDGKWLEAGPDTIGRFSAVGYYFARDLQKDLNVPVGIIHTSWGGTRVEAWISRAALESDPAFKAEVENYEKAKANYPKLLEKYKADKEAYDKLKAEGKAPPQEPKPPQDPTKNPNSASVLYNGMIAPLIPYAVKGALWYQGESNAGQPDRYREGFPLMIRTWRQDWREGDFPFLFVQLAPFMKIEEQPTDTGWTRLRDAQLHTLRTVKNTGMAVITDLGDQKDIHPKRKEQVGQRLELAALALAYHKPIEYSGPVFDKMMVEGNQAVLSFTHVGKGLEIRPNPDLPEQKQRELAGFTIAGEDGKFVPAKAEIKGDKVVVSSDQVTKPVAVRFGWANYPVTNLYNKEGLPATPFRTDDWPAGGPRK